MRVDDGDWKRAVEGWRAEGDGGRTSQGQRPMSEVLIEKVTRERQRTRSCICDAGLAGTSCGMSNTELVGGASSSASF